LNKQGLTRTRKSVKIKEGVFMDPKTLSNLDPKLRETY